MRVGCAADFHEVAVLLHLHDKPLFTLRIVGPLQGEAVGGSLRQRKVHWCPQEKLTILAGDTVDIVLDVRIAVVGDGHGVVFRWVGAVSLLPIVRHPVAITVHRLLAFEPRP